MPTDTSGYEERYRLTGTDAAPLAGIAVVTVVGGIWFHTLAPIAIGGALALPYIIVIAGHRVAFRADHTGITLGLNLTGLKLYAVRVPWADVEQIVLYSLRQSSSRQDVLSRLTDYIGIKRREGAPALSHGNQPAANCPEPGVAAGATRAITTWRFDRNRLAAVTAVAAPAIRIVDYGTIDVRR
jgi:hypothetical protein